MFYGYQSSIIHACVYIHVDILGFLWITMNWLCIFSIQGRSQKSSFPGQSLTITSASIVQSKCRMCEHIFLMKQIYNSAEGVGLDKSFLFWTITQHLCFCLPCCALRCAAAHAGSTNPRGHRVSEIIHPWWLMGDPFIIYWYVILSRYLTLYCLKFRTTIQGLTSICFLL